MNQNPWHRNRKYDKKRHSLAPFNKEDVALACNVTPRTLQRWCKKDKIRLEKLSLSQLVEFINKHRKQP